MPITYDFKIEPGEVVDLEIAVESAEKTNWLNAQANMLAELKQILVILNEMAPHPALQVQMEQSLRDYVEDLVLQSIGRLCQDSVLFKKDDDECGQEKTKAEQKANQEA